MAAKPPVIFLLGPTASGKTDLAILLREQIDAELISVDSAQVYRGLDIGAAKPDAETLARAPHRLIDIRDPAEPYSAAEFKCDALSEIDAIVGAGKVPILVGGTMLYFKVLLEGMADLPAADQDLRREIEQRAAQQGWPALHAELAKVDPQSAAELHPNHSARIERALEVYQLTGVPLSEHKKNQTDVSPLANYRVIQLGLDVRNREMLHHRIAQRFHNMMAQGFLGEVETLWRRGDLNVGLPSIRSAGYAQLWQHFAAGDPLETAVNKGIFATRQLAKRQLTWMRGWDGLQTLAIDDDRGDPKSVEILLSDALKIVSDETILLGHNLL